MDIASRIKQIKWTIRHRKLLFDFAKSEYRAEQERERKRQIAEQIEIIRRSEFFDGEWYLRNHIELQDKGIDPAEDYLLRGIPWRNPSERFVSLEYWFLHPDVEKAGMNPLLHYETQGRRSNASIYTRQLESSAHAGDANQDSPVISLEAHRASFEDKVAAIRRKVENGEKIRAVFFVSNVPMFSLRPLFEHMREDGLFDPVIVIIPDYRKADYEAEMSRCEVELLNAGYPRDAVSQAPKDQLGRWEDACIGADIVCYDLPYYNTTSFRYTPYYAIGRSFLPIMANYTYPQSLYARKIMALDTYGCMWKVFLECDETLREYQSFSGTGGDNAALVGYIKMDSMSRFSKPERNRKTILVALHHSIDGGANDSIAFANFIRYFEYFHTLPDRHPEIDFVYRPHPFLFDALHTAEGWTSSQLEDFKAEMAAKPNFQWSIGGEYLQAFAESDACIQDCGSFMVEYLYTGNPCCYMLKDPSDIEGKFSPLGQACLDHYYLSYNMESIEEFIADVVVEGHDTMAESRKEFARSVMMNYPRAAEAALQDIKESIFSS